MEFFSTESLGPTHIPTLPIPVYAGPKRVQSFLFSAVLSNIGLVSPIPVYVGPKGPIIPFQFSLIKDWSGLTHSGLRWSKGGSIILCQYVGESIRAGPASG